MTEEFANCPTCGTRSPVIGAFSLDQRRLSRKKAARCPKCDTAFIPAPAGMIGRLFVGGDYDGQIIAVPCDWNQACVPIDRNKGRFEEGHYFARSFEKGHVQIVVMVDAALEQLGLNRVIERLWQVAEEYSEPLPLTG